MFMICRSRRLKLLDLEADSQFKFLKMSLPKVDSARESSYDLCDEMFDQTLKKEKK